MKKSSAIKQMTKSKQAAISRELNKHPIIALCFLMLGPATNISGQVQTSLNDEQKIAVLALLWKEADYNFVFFGKTPNLDWTDTFKRFIPQSRDGKSLFIVRGIVNNDLVWF